MIYLLDTHVVLWWLENPRKLSPQAVSTIENQKHIIYLSSVATWEIAVKKMLGKLEVPDSIFTLLETSQFEELPVSIEHTKALLKLPFYHHDPFDRLLIAQAMTEKCPILTRDQIFPRYDVVVMNA